MWLEQWSDAPGVSRLGAWVVWGGVLAMGVALVGCPQRQELRQSPPPRRTFTASADASSAQTAPPSRPTTTPTPSSQTSRPRPVRRKRPLYRRAQARRTRRSRFVYVSSNAYHFYLLGRMHAQAQRRAKAILAYKSALVYDPQSRTLHYNIARQFQRMKRWRSAFFWARKMLSMDPKDARAYHLLGQLHHSQEQPRKAAQHYRKAIQLQPTTLKAYLDLDRLWRRRYDKRRLLQTLLQKAIKALPQRHEPYLRLGRLYEKTLREKQAIRLYRQALNRKPSESTGLSHLGGIYYRLRRWDKAIKTYESLLDYRPDAWQFRLLLASTYLSRNKPHDAAMAAYQFRVVQEEEASLARAARLFRIGWEHHARGRWQKALSWLKKALQRDPSLSQVRLSLSAVHLMQGRLAQALEVLAAIPASDKDGYLEAVARRIDLLLAAGKASAAESLYRAERKRYAGQTKSVLQLSQAFVERASVASLKAEAAFFRKQHKASPKDHEVLFHLAYIQFRRKKYASAIALLRTLRKQRPNHSSALNFLGYIYAVRKTRLNVAAGLLRRALFLEPGNGYFLDSLGWVRLQQGRRKRALVLLEQAHHLLPNEVAVTVHLGRVYQLLGRTREARQLYRLAARAVPPPDVARQLRRYRRQLPPVSRK